MSASAMNRGPTYLTADICFHFCRPLVRNETLVVRMGCSNPERGPAGFRLRLCFGEKSARSRLLTDERMFGSNSP